MNNINDKELEELALKMDSSRKAILFHYQCIKRDMEIAIKQGSPYSSLLTKAEEQIKEIENRPADKYIKQKLERELVVLSYDWKYAGIYKNYIRFETIKPVVLSEDTISVDTGHWRLSINTEREDDVRLLPIDFVEKEFISPSGEVAIPHPNIVLDNMNEEGAEVRNAYISMRIAEEARQMKLSNATSTALYFLHTPINTYAYCTLEELARWKEDVDSGWKRPQKTYAFVYTPRQYKNNVAFLEEEDESLQDSLYYASMQEE